MAEIAQIIVDVPTMQTNRPYTYQVPQEWQHQIKIGMRVVVPFGNGTRKVEGVVVGLDETSTYDGQLKKIDSLMDLNPVLNDELLQLSQWMANQTFAFQITCIHTMLPAMLKTKTQKYLHLIDEVDEETFLTQFHGLDEIEFNPEKLTKPQLSQLLKLKKQEKVEVVYRVRDRAKPKTVLGISPALTFEQYEEQRSTLNRQAKAQNRLLSYLQSVIGKTIKLTEARQNSALSTAVFNTGAKKGWLIKKKVEIYRTPTALQDTAIIESQLKLNDEQQIAVSAINQAVDQHEDKTFLLEGVTGSGKTEVYLQCIKRAIDQGQTAIMLVPEISLTPQIVARVKRRFGSDVAVLHSGLSNGEKYDEWRRIENQEAHVVVGARSAIFAPVTNLGLIILDEEHETSYKQDETPRYHARDVAKWRAKYHHAPLVLGSATPSLESRARAEKKVYHQLMLTQRVNHHPMPEVNVVDMRQELRKHAESNFSTELLEALAQRITRGEQSILMLNRRGYSSFIMCRDCGFVLQCPNCDISLTLHMDTHTMKCHYCGHEEAIPDICPNCHSHQIRYYGTGTQKVEAELAEKLPNARILRMDVDTTRRKGMHEKILRQFGDHKADILLGTQMIAKGLDYPNVTLVGVLNADTGLGLPDFRASEHTFQLLTQVSGRAGRADKPGQVIIQTYNPDHYAIQLARKHDFERFFQVEMQIRHRGKYPPYFYTVQITVSHEDEAVAAKTIFDLANFLNNGLGSTCIMLGPTPRSIARMNRRYYYQMVIKYQHSDRLHALLMQVMQTSQKLKQRGLQISVDPEPQYFI